MTNTQSNKYYLQALEEYPYNLSDTLESLNYALSCDSGHAGAHCLLGQLYKEQLRLYEKAQNHFEIALISDMDYFATYEHYSLLLIELREFGKATNLLKYASKIKGANYSVIYHRFGLLNESVKEYDLSKVYYQIAFEEAINEEDRNFMDVELKRVKAKMSLKKGKRSKKKK